MVFVLVWYFQLLDLLGAFHIYMRHLSSERQLSSLILHANIKCDDDDVMFLGKKQEDQKVRMRTFKSTT